MLQNEWFACCRWLLRSLLCVLCLRLWPSAAFAQDTLMSTEREAARRRTRKSLHGKRPLDPSPLLRPVSLR
jgi:hypothetical protein